KQRSESLGVALDGGGDELVGLGRGDFHTMSPRHRFSIQLVRLCPPHRSTVAVQPATLVRPTMSIDRETLPLAEWDPLAGRWTEPTREVVTTADGHHALWRSPAIRNGIVGGIAGALVASLVLIPIARHNGSTIVERR